MGALVDDLLYLSRIDAGQLALSVEDVNVDELITATTERFAYQAETGEVTVRRALTAGTVRGDGRRLEQVFTNLLENAIRFAPRGTEVLLRSYRYGANAVIEVHNGGEPIPAEALPHVFDRFFQGDPSRRRGHQGLGLAIVQELVQAHGGTVSVQSAPESGTTFTVRLPLAGPPPPTEAPGAAEGAHESEADPALRLEPEAAS
jgi:signal transduction histidine kinase